MELQTRTKYFEGINSLHKLKETYTTLSESISKTTHEYIMMRTEFHNLYVELKTIHSEQYPGFFNNDLVDILYSQMKVFNYKPGWVVYMFLNKTIKPTQFDFKYLEQQMKYKYGWAKINFDNYYLNGK